MNASGGGLGLQDDFRRDTIPLDIAIANRNVAICQLLLDYDADPNISFVPTPLSAAAETGNLTLVRMLIKTGADVNASSPSEIIGRSKNDALYAAALGGHRKIVEVLRQVGADNRGEPLPLPRRVMWKSQARWTYAYDDDEDDSELEYRPEYNITRFYT